MMIDDHRAIVLIYLSFFYLVITPKFSLHSKMIDITEYVKLADFTGMQCGAPSFRNFGLYPQPLGY